MLMCRPKEQGGRRCPNRGGQKRLAAAAVETPARDAAYYASLNPDWDASTALQVADFAARVTRRAGRNPAREDQIAAWMGPLAVCQRTGSTSPSRRYVRVPRRGCVAGCP